MLYVTNTSLIENIEYVDLPHLPWKDPASKEISSADGFIEANTIVSSLAEIQTQHIIPVFAKDSEPLINHVDFIATVQDAVRECFRGERILQPAIRLSHPIKGRIPEAKTKPAAELLDHERTIYYERMMFAIEIPTIHEDIDGNRINLTIGGVKSYNLDNLFGRKGNDEHFTVFIGFQNKACTNMKIWSDGYIGNLKVCNLEDLSDAVHLALRSYDAVQHVKRLKQLPNYSLTERQFAQLIGRCRLYNYLPSRQRSGIPPLLFGDQQVGAVCRDYYQDESFCRDADGSVNLWKLLNLFTGANKASYIDAFLPRTLNAAALVDQLQDALDGKSASWYLQ